MNERSYSPWLHRFAVLVVVVTFLVIISGGNVTSRGAGMAVPDGYRVFGYFLWTFPVERWVGNIFHEHIHRLKGSVIGLLIITLTVWLFLSQKQRPWLRMVGLITLVMVLVQGMMGAARVNRISTTYAIVHGVHAQFLLCMTVWIAAATGRIWQKRASTPFGPVYASSLRYGSLLLLGVLLVQLVLGALVRHHGATLAIPDFPAHYGGLVPPFTQAGIVAAHDAIVPYERSAAAYPTPLQVVVHFAHRVWALVVLFVAGWLITRVAARAAADRVLLRPSAALVLLLIVQLFLGVVVITSGRHAELATTHQATGAVILATAALLMIRLHALRPLSVGDLKRDGPVMTTGRQTKCP